MLIPMGILAASGAGAAGAYELISSTILTGNSTGITFSSIPQTYKHLQLRVVSIADGGFVNDYMRFNGVTSGVYTDHSLLGVNGSVTSNFNGINQTRINLSASGNNAGAYGVKIIDITDYASSSKFKTIKNFAGFQYPGYPRVELHSGLYMQTTAISSLTIYNESAANYTSGTRWSLYGIKG